MTSAIAQLIFESPQMAPLALAVAAVALVAMVVLYGPQSRGLDWRWRSGLWVLRCVALLAVAGSIVKPAILRQRRGGEESAAVVVLIDTSRSMGARDYAAATTQPTARMSDATTMPAAALKVPSGIQQTLVALADGLGLLPAGARSGRLVEIDAELNHVAALLDDLRLARQEWEYAQRSARGADLAEARVVTAAGAVNGAAKHLAESTSGAQTGAAASLASALSRLSAACQTLVNRRANPADISRADGLAQTARDAVSRAQAEQDIQLYKTDLKVQSICDDVARP
jgi:hypothetical protein